ncbi:Bgt-4130 [Blumeria graminis f. sp. tritici]|uniref:Indigoidine synthase n=3 Tax=Blumeria graminis f. sp. tritici TaxID=62690 RepID=A0A656KIM8_BLUGR|nr:Indigoidine synthase [Blumeria graminis f. sp. tritici 96224]VDB90992.1 Bgt-4130 [Blumeria graminis f. sp. tritici]
MNRIVTARFLLKPCTARFLGFCKWTREYSINILGRKFINVSEEVNTALNEGQPIVALESTIYTHGWPNPDNLRLALHLKDLVRSHGAIPATVGVVNGVATVGLSDEELTILCGAAAKPDTMKISRRDLPYILGMGIAGRLIHGGTTVSSTMILAHWAGIRVFATGGIGGVHRGGQDSMDVSADLTELGRTPIAVVCSGCKSFLDIPRTLEFLETQGTMVATFSQGRIGDVEFPAFYARESGVKSPMVVQDFREAAAIVLAQTRMGITSNLNFNSGTLFANPIPEEFSIPKAEISEAINQAVQEASERGFHGHANTPFILARIKDITNGRSLPANRSLIESNVQTAAKLAAHLASLLDQDKDLNIPAHRTGFTKKVSKIDSMLTSASLERKVNEDDSLATGDCNPSSKKTNDITRPRTENVYKKDSNRIISSDPGIMKTRNASESEPETPITAEVIVFGAIAIDSSCDLLPIPGANSNTNLQPTMHTSNVARIRNSIGGVGHNVAVAAHKVSGDQRIRLCSFVADDSAGRSVISQLQSKNIDTTGILVIPTTAYRSKVKIQNRTAQYIAVNDGKKDLVVGMGDMEIFKQNSHRLGFNIPSFTKWVVIDANWDPAQIREFMYTIRARNPWVKIAFEPVSQKKGADILRKANNPTQDEGGLSLALKVFPKHLIDLSTPNIDELDQMYRAAVEEGYLETNDYWSVLDGFGISGAQTQEKLQAIVGKKLTDQGLPQKSIKLLPYIPMLLTKLGPEGVLLTELLMVDDSRLKDPEHARWIFGRTTKCHLNIGGVYMRLFPAADKVDPADIVSVNGVGDTFLGVLMAGLSKGLSVGEKLIEIAQRGAILTLKSNEAVSPKLSCLAQDLDKLIMMESN